MKATAVHVLLALSVAVFWCTAQTVVNSHGYTPTLYSSEVLSSVQYPFEMQWSSAYADTIKKRIYFTGTICLEWTCRSNTFTAFDMSIDTLQIDTMTNITTEGRRPYAQVSAKYTPVMNDKYAYLVGQDSYYTYYQNIFIMNRNASSIGNCKFHSTSKHLDSDYFARDLYKTAATVATGTDSAVVIVCTTNKMVKYECVGEKCKITNMHHLGWASSRPALLASGPNDIVAITTSSAGVFYVVPVDLKLGFLDPEHSFEFKEEHLTRNKFKVAAAFVTKDSALYVVFQNTDDILYYSRDGQPITSTIVKLTLMPDGKKYQLVFSKQFKYEGSISAYTHNETHMFVGTTGGYIGYINLKQLEYDEKAAMVMHQVTLKPFSTMVLVDDVIVA
jgi:hypothetical protein